MVQRTLLDSDEITKRLAGLPGWAVEQGRLRKHYEFHDFVQAFGFMARCALEAQQLDHHPDWRNVYKKVEVELWTHDAGGLTALDFELAEAMDRRAAD